MLNYLYSVRWQDVVDIAVIAFVTYRVLLFFVDTRAMQLLRGIVIIAVIGGIASWSEFRTISWLLSHVLQAFLIAIPVVFQPELRRLLAELGKGRFLGRSSRADEQAEERAKAMFEAIQYFETHRVGALLVFQREDGLREIWRSAVRLDAEISKELMISVFWPNSSLHDGAVIVDRKTLVAASCYLPLTDNNEISRWFGTRHRAAVGITEISDAVALIVSEETGHTSMSVGGKLAPLDNAQTQMFLNRYFTLGDKAGSDRSFGSLVEQLKRDIQKESSKEADTNV